MCVCHQYLYVDERRAHYVPKHITMLLKSTHAHNAINVPRCMCTLTNVDKPSQHHLSPVMAEKICYIPRPTDTIMMFEYYPYSRHYL